MGQGPHFWSDSMSEPKKAYNWVMTFNGVPQWMLKTAPKPNFSITTQAHKFLNHQFHYPGRVEWQAIDATIVDTVAPDANATQEIMHILEESGYDLPTVPGAPPAGFGTVSKDKAVNAALGLIKIRTINAAGNPVEEWNLNNAFLTNADFGNLSYDSDDLSVVTLTIQYDNAFVNVLNGDGTIPRTSA